MPPSSNVSAGRIYLVVGLDLIAFATLMPLLASYGSRAGASPAEVGLLVAAYSIMHVLLAGWWGRVSDRIGRRPVLLIGMVGSVAGALLFSVAHTWLLLIASRILAGGAGATLNVAQAYLADITPPARRTRAMGLLGATYGVGFIVGPVLGGVASSIGDAAPGLVAAGCAAIGLLLALLLVPEPAERLAPIAGAATEPLPRERWVLYLSSGAITAAFTVMYVVFPLFGEATLGLDRSQVSYLFAYVGVGNAVVQGGVAGRVASRLGELGTGLLGAILLAVGFLAIPLAARLPNPVVFPSFLASLLVVAVGFGLSGPSITGRLSRLAGSSQGLVLGQLQGANSLARAVGPLLAGTVFELGGSLAAFIASGLFGGIAVVALMQAGRASRPARLQAADR